MFISTCQHQRSAPIAFIRDLHPSQAGKGRHKCVECAWEEGYQFGLGGGVAGGDIECKTSGEFAPGAILENLPQSQAGPGRHKCCICAYHDGYKVGKKTTNPKSGKKIIDNHEENRNLKSHSRSEIRKEVTGWFLEEKCGDIGRTSRYTYFVETLASGKKLYLTRPARYNQGTDFQIWIETADGSPNVRPSHNDIFEDLEAKKIENSAELKILLNLIMKVGQCEDPNTLLQDIHFTFKKGFSVDTLLKVLRWLLIEQDVTYWNHSGRQMLLNAISERLGI